MQLRGLCHWTRRRHPQQQRHKLVVQVKVLQCDIKYKFEVALSEIGV